MKKEYLRPEADYINFYTEEEMTTEDGVGGGIISGENELGGDAPDNW